MIYLYNARTDFKHRAYTNVEVAYLIYGGATARVVMAEWAFYGKVFLQYEGCSIIGKREMRKFKRLYYLRNVLNNWGCIVCDKKRVDMSLGSRMANFMASLTILNNSILRYEEI